MKQKLATSVFYTLITIGSSLLPLIASAIVLLIYDESIPGLLDLTGLGQIVIICIPISIGILYTLYDMKSNVGIHKITDFFYWLTLLLSILAIIIYAYGIKEFKINQAPRENLVIFSLIFLGWIIISTFFTKLFEMDSFSVIESRDSDIKELERKYKNR